MRTPCAPGRRGAWGKPPRSDGRSPRPRRQGVRRRRSRIGAAGSPRVPLKTIRGRADRITPSIDPPNAMGFWEIDPTRRSSRALAKDVCVSMERRNACTSYAPFERSRGAPNAGSPALDRRFIPVTLQAKARTAPAIRQTGQRATEPTKGLAERHNLHPGPGCSCSRRTNGSHRPPRLETRLSPGPETRVAERRPRRFVALGTDAQAC